MPRTKTAPDAGRLQPPQLSCDVLAAEAGVAHGFFTRKGGVSAGIFDSLNCGYGSGDDMAKVTENRGRVAAALGVKPDSFCTAYQVHSPDVVVLDKPWRWQEAPEADAMVTKTPGLALGILTADCLPILFADGKNGVIGAAHAGWKGAIAGVIEATIEVMCKEGASKSSIAACIGPGIAQKSYEVGADFRMTFIGQSADNDQFFISSANADRFLFDLPAYGRMRLRAAGITKINLLAHDTCSEENSFFSYRRSCLRGVPAYGRQVSAIALAQK